MRDPKRRASEPTFEETYAALRRELGFDDVTSEQLYDDLFGDLDLEPPREPDGPVRVEQVVDDRRPPRDTKKR